MDKQKKTELSLLVPHLEKTHYRHTHRALFYHQSCGNGLATPGQPSLFGKRKKKIPAPPWSDHLASLAPLPPFRSSGACSSLCCPDHGAGSDSELAEKDQSPAACFAFSPRSSPVREAWFLLLFLAEPGFFAGQLRNRLCSDLGAQSSHCTQS